MSRRKPLMASSRSPRARRRDARLTSAVNVSDALPATAFLKAASASPLRPRALRTSPRVLNISTERGLAAWNDWAACSASA